MEIAYKITAAQQKKQLLAGENASIKQTITLPDSDLTGGILSHRNTSVSPAGAVSIDIESPLPHIQGQNIRYATDCGAASGNVSHKEYVTRWRGCGIWAADMRYYCDHMIASVEDLTCALAEIDAIGADRQAEADRLTRESAETFHARIDAYNAEHTAKPDEDLDGKPEQPEPEKDPFALYRHLDGLNLVLQHDREDQAEKMVLDFIEGQFEGKMAERGLELLDTSDLEYSSIAGYDGDIPVDGLRKLDQLADIDGTPYVYYEDTDRYLGLDVDLKFARKCRLVVVNVYQWDEEG